MAKSFTAYSNEDYVAYLATNVTGFFHMTQRSIELMSKQGRGHVLTVSTSLVDQPMTSVPAVLASLTKGGLNAATKSLAIEYARKGVWVNAVSAGIINTPCIRLRPTSCWPPCIRWVEWEKCPTSWTQSCTWNQRDSCLEKYFTSMEGRRPVIMRSREVLVTCGDQICPVNPAHSFHKAVS